MTFGALRMLDLPAPPTIDGHFATIWRYNTSIATAWELSRPILDLARPAGVQLHGGWRYLLRDGPAVIAKVKSAGFIPFVGIAGDGDSYEDRRGENAAARWPLVAEMCAAEGVACLMINAEGRGAADPGHGWTPHDIPQLIEALAGMNEVRGAMLLGHTSFGQPIWFEDFPFGGFPHYPWEPQLSRVQVTHPQIYYSPKRRRYAGYERAWAEMAGRYQDNPEAPPMVSCPPDLRRELYVDCATDPGTAASDPGDTVWTCGHHQSICWWTLPGYDNPGRLAFLAANKLWHLGYRDVALRPAPGEVFDAFFHPVKCYQIDNGLTVDGDAGPLTRGALGVK